ncbi:MAG: DNA-binding protein WhiA [Eubacteriaceae bacterium]|jgi:DNA-binding protein WhiA|nr:DNA-binding protein WhiA [Eubacteriaceae bacterium]
MSFASETKNELARVMPDKKECMLAEIAGFIRVCGSIGLVGGGRFKIVLNTENNAVARHYKKLIKEYFSVDAQIDVGQGQTLKKGKYYIITIGPENLSDQILRETGILMVREGMNFISDGIYEGLIRKKSERKAYLRGLFLGAGTMTNPDNQYLFEIVCNSDKLASDVRKLINSFTDIHAKKVQRKKEYVTYVKNSGQILDILAIMGAHSQYFAYEDVIMRKELRNEANRRSNCDQANIDKALAASEKQTAAIRQLRDDGRFDTMPAKLREIAELRLDNPDATLVELGEMLDPPLKKAGVNSRLKRIMELAEGR